MSACPLQGSKQNSVIVYYCSATWDGLVFFICIKVFYLQYYLFPPLDSLWVKQNLNPVSLPLALVWFQVSASVQIRDTEFPAMLAALPGCAWTQF